MLVWSEAQEASIRDLSCKSLSCFLQLSNPSRKLDCTTPANKYNGQHTIRQHTEVVALESVCPSRFAAINSLITTGQGCLRVATCRNIRSAAVVDKSRTSCAALHASNMSTQSPQSGSPSQTAAPALPSHIEPDHRHSPVLDVESPTRNIQDEGEGGSKSPSPELPGSDKSTTSDEEESGGEPAKALTPTYDEETQETAMVPDSAEPTPTSSLPALPSSAVKKLASPFPSHPQANSILTPSRLSKGSLEKLQQDLLVQDDTTLTDLALATGDDSISLQSDLTIADLDSDDWKQMVISYGAEPRSDDEEIFDSLAQYNPSGNSASRKRRENRVSASARKAARAGTAHTPSKSASRIESAPTPIRSTGRTLKTYGKKGHRASTSTGSEAEVQPSTRTTTSANTTSEESDCVEVTTARKAGVLRHVTPDGTVLGNLEAYTPSKRPQSTSKGKSRATATAVEEDYDMDLDLPELSPVKKEQQKLEKKNIRKREREEKKRISTPSLSPPHSAPAPFVPLSTAAPDGKALSALEIIAQMKAKKKPPPQTAQLQQSAYKNDDDLDLQLAGDIDLKRRVVAMQEDDSDDDDLMDSKALFESVKNAPRLPIPKPEAPVASTSKSTFKVKLPMDKASQSLNKLFKTRQAEEARGWYGIDGTADREKEEAAKRSASASSEDRSARIRGSDSDGSCSDSDSDSSLPDAPPIAGSKDNKQKKQKSKKRRRLSDGNFERVATELHAGHEDSSIVDAIHFAQDQLEEDRRRAEQMRAQEARKFWKSDEQMTIDVSCCSEANLSSSSPLLHNVAFQAIRDSRYERFRLRSSSGYFR